MERGGERGGCWDGDGGAAGEPGAGAMRLLRGEEEALLQDDPGSGEALLRGARAAGGTAPCSGWGGFAGARNPGCVPACVRPAGQLSSAQQ